MNIIETSQAYQTAAWLEARRGRITGTRSGALALEHYAQKDLEKIQGYIEKNRALADKAKTEAKADEYLDKAKDYETQYNQAIIDNKRYKVPQEYWQLLAERVAEEPDGENAADHGHRLENENAALVLHKLGISEDDANFDTGLWVDDEEPRLAISPDVTELSLEPTWAIECKSLGTANHLKAVLPIILDRIMKGGSTALNSDIEQAAFDAVIEVLPAYVGDENHSALDFVPEAYQAQALQYFVVNQKLETLYFSFYDPRCYDDTLVHQFLKIDRADIEPRIKEHRERQLAALHTQDVLLKAIEGLREDAE